MRSLVSIALLVSAACSAHQTPSSAPTPAASPAASAGPSAQQGNRDSIKVAALRIRTEIAGFRVARRRDYDDPAAGILVRYHGPPPFAADVYLYPILEPTLAATDAGRDSAAALEFRRARDDIYALQKHRGGAAPKALAERQVNAPAGNGRIAHGWRGTFSYPRDGGTWTSHLYLFGMRDRYLKVRSSYLEHDGPVEPPPVLEQFVQALVAALADGYERATQP